jgi:hypothetical protein
MQQIAHSKSANEANMLKCAQSVLLDLKTFYVGKKNQR